MLSKKKKIIILAVMAVLLVATGYLNITLNNRITEQVNTTNNASSGNFFQTYRLDRTNTRNQEIAYLDAIIANTASTDEAKELAETKKVALVQTMELELVIEGLIKAKGFEDVVVTNTSSNVNIIVKGAELSTSEVSQIVSVVKDQTGKDIDNIKIIPIDK